MLKIEIWNLPDINSSIHEQKKAHTKKKTKHLRNGLLGVGFSEGEYVE